MNEYICMNYELSVFHHSMNIKKFTVILIIFYLFLWMCRRSPLSATVCLKYLKNTLARGYSSSACPWSKWRTAFFFRKKSPLALLFNCCFSADPLLFLSPWRFEIEIEPIFASLALYDVKEKKKVSCYAFLSTSSALSCWVTSANHWNCWEAKWIWWVDYKIVCCGPVMLIGLQLDRTMYLSEDYPPLVLFPPL